MVDEQTKRAADELLNALRPLDVRAQAMFGGYCFYVGEKVAGLVCNGRIFVKRSARDELLEGFAELAPAYPGTNNSWRLPVDALRRQPDQIRDIVEQVAAVLPVRKLRKTNR
ncbi:MAG: TfoX/Sxy family protein [Longispora sp.]|nr:TfoX/Sxy family protein [Longispora sp. (in: high G+C Gram-positive bacteria)]